MFAFGRNWQRFLRVVDEPRIAMAQAHLRRMLEVDSLAGMRFLDVGSGSGLSSLAAWRLGAEVHSFDYDENSVRCTAEMRRRYAGDGARWSVEHGSVLDPAYLRTLGKFDVVHAWGVLHHTGAMWPALENVLIPLGPGGRLFVAIYNDVGQRSRMWHTLKRIYNALPTVIRVPYATAVIGAMEAEAAVRHVLTLRPHVYARRWFGYDKKRGMNPIYDWIDWIGGYPYEVARVDEIFTFYRKHGLTMTAVSTDAGLGCNEFVFVAPNKPADSTGREHYGNGVVAGARA